MFKKNKTDFKAKLEHKLYLARENPEPIFDISDCGLKEIPSGIFSLCRVFLKEKLLMNNNKLNSFNNGGSLTDLQFLKILDIQNNLFTCLPRDIAFLTNLQELYINNNKIKELPSAIGSLINLHLLDVSYNLLKILPSEIGNLSCLEYINVNGNSDLKKLPCTLANISNLKKIDLQINNFIYPPVEVIENGLEAIMKFLCTENGTEYKIPSPKQEECSTITKPLKLLTDSDSDLQEQKHKELLQLEKNFQNMHLKELKLHEASKVARQKILTDITEQQNKLENDIVRIQNIKEEEKIELLKKLQEDEKQSYLAINQLLNLNKYSLAQLAEKEQLEKEYLLSWNLQQNEVLRRNDILNAMQNMLENETKKFKNYDQHREETTQAILAQEMLANTHLLSVLKYQEKSQAQLVSKIQKDIELQRFAVATFLEQSDARSWSLIQQVRLVESELANLTAIEMNRRKLQVDEQLNSLTEKRLSLSLLLIDLLNQQEKRRMQLLSTLQDMEQISKTQEDYWLVQYQKLLDKRPELTSDIQKNIDPRLAQELLLAGVIHCLPFLANLIQTIGFVNEFTEEELINAGIKNKDDRLLILQAFYQYKKLYLCDASKGNPSAPRVSISSSDSPSAPPESPNEFTSASECVICMELECQTIFFPCGHLCCCSTCALSVTDCPLCRGFIERRIKILLP